jgi:chromosomal replication initiation ATPase DnaA
VCSKYGVSEFEIISQSRARDLAHVRAVITLLVREFDGLSIIEVAKKLKRTPGGLSRLAHKLDKKCDSSPLLKQGIILLKNELLLKNKSTSHV